MKKTLFLRIFSGNAAGIILLAAAVMLFAPPLMRKHNIEEKASSLEHMAVLLEPQIIPYLTGSGTGDLHSLVVAFSRQTGTRITVIDMTGMVLADSEKEARDMENHFYRPEIQASLNGEKRMSIRRSSTLKQEMMYMSVPLEASGRVVGALRLSLFMRSLEALLGVFRRELLKVVGLTLLAALLMVFFLSKSVSGPVREVIDASSRVAAGDFEASVSVRRSGEFKRFAQSFNAMTGKLKTMFDELRTLEKTKKDFIVNVSHELRTPLTAIKGFLDTIETRAEEENRPYLEIIRRNTERMIDIVKDLLVLSELEERGTKIDKTEVDMKPLAESILKMFEKRAADKGLALSLEAAPPLPAVLADPGQMEGLLLNLVDNAVKYTDKGSVKVRLSVHGANLAIEVEDTGPGIDTGHLPHIFERFYVVDRSRSKKLGGTGLGLSIVKHIILAHRGSVSVKSRVGVGTTFSVLLPLA
jgi:signal transduction histidine kinase